MIKIIYHEYESKEDAFEEAIFSGRMLLKIVFEDEKYTVRLYKKESFLRFVKMNMEENGELYLNGATIVVDGILTEDVVLKKIYSLTPRYFSSLKCDE